MAPGLGRSDARSLVITGKADGVAVLALIPRPRPPGGRRPPDWIPGTRYRLVITRYHVVITEAHACY